MRTFARGVAVMMATGFLAAAALPSSAQRGAAERGLLGVRLWRTYSDVLRRHGAPTRIEIGAVTGPMIAAPGAAAQGGFAAMPGMGGGMVAGRGLPGMPGMGGMPGMPGMGGMGGMPGMPGMGGMGSPAGGGMNPYAGVAAMRPGMGGMPGMPGMGSPAGGTSAGMMPGMSPGRGLPGLPGMPGMGSPAGGTSAGMMPGMGGGAAGRMGFAPGTPGGGMMFGGMTGPGGGRGGMLGGAAATADGAAPGPMGGLPGMAGMPGMPGMGGAQATQISEGEITWVYERGQNTHMFLFNRDGRVIQIQSFGYRGGTPTARGVGLGATLNTVFARYGWTANITKSGDSMTLDYGRQANVAFQLLDSRRGQGYRVVGITVAAMDDNR